MALCCLRIFSFLFSWSKDMPITLGDTSITGITGNQGIGTDNPVAGLHVAKGKQALGFDSGIHISANPTDGTAGRGSGITFQNLDVYTAGIYALRAPVSGWNGALAFYTHTGNSGNTFGGTTFTEKMRIDDVGRVTMPYQPAFHAQARSSANGNTAIGVGDTLQYGVASFNIGSHYNTSTFRFTAPVAGVYSIAFSISYFRNATAGRRSIRITRNGNTFEYVDFTPNNDYDIVELSTLMSLAVNDFVDIRGLTIGSGDQYWGGTAQVGSFRGFLVG
jgi:hypothetical protein